jgi:hypothetical protein
VRTVLVMNFLGLKSLFGSVVIDNFIIESGLQYLI